MIQIDKEALTALGKGLQGKSLDTAAKDPEKDPEPRLQKYRKPTQLGFTIGNDNLFPFKVKMSDSGISSQISAYVTGHLGGTYHAGLKPHHRYTTYTAQLDHTILTGAGGNKSAELGGEYGGVSDELDALNGEIWRVSGNISQHIHRQSGTLVFSATADVNRSTPMHIQDFWHKLTMGEDAYLRSQKNLFKPAMHVGLDLSAEHTWHGKNVDLALRAGTSLGTDYNGVMAGGSVGIGPGRQSAPVTYASQFDNADINRAPINYTKNYWSFTAYANVYLGRNNAIITPSDNNPYTHPTVHKTGYQENVMGNYIGDSFYRDEKTNQIIRVPQYEISSVQHNLEYNLPGKFTYDFSALNAVVGVKAQLKVSKIVLFSEMKFMTNPAHASVNPEYNQQRDEIIKNAPYRNNADNYSAVTEDGKPTDYTTTGEYRYYTAVPRASTQVDPLVPEVKTPDRKGILTSAIIGVQFNLGGGNKSHGITR